MEDMFVYHCCNVPLNPETFLDTFKYSTYNTLTVKEVRIFSTGFLLYIDFNSLLPVKYLHKII